MSFILNVTALDIANWSDQAHAKSQFPELIRRLVFATAPYLLHIDFPVGDNTYEGGWDAVIIEGIGNAYIPEGQSGWELGTTKAKKDKAEKDYAERTKNSLGLEQSETSFVLVSPRNWSASSKREWKEEKQKENIWKNVLLYDAKDIEGWLSIAPAVQYWFGRLINKRPENISDLDNYWLDWAAETTPSTPDNLLRTGRQKVVNEVHQWLKGSTGSFGLQTDSRGEAVAFFAAAIKALHPDERTTYFTRCVVVHSVNAWRQLITITTPLILIPVFDDHTVISSALRQGHRVFVPLDRADKAWGDNTTELPRLPRTEVQEILEKIGVPEEKASRLAGVARRSFAAFRRAMTDKPSVQKPTWTSTDKEDILIASLLIGAWDEQKEGDTEVVAFLAGVSYPEVKKQLNRWVTQADPPVRFIGTTWYIVDKGDVWGLIYETITEEHLQRFDDLALRVLGSVPPRYELPPEEWYRAEILGYGPTYSRVLRESMATTLTFLGTFEESLPLARLTTADVANRTVRHLLSQANKDWRIWSALSNYLRMLAEAAPDIFLDAVEQSLRDSSPAVMELFKERKDLVSATGDYPGLLWALEVVAWHPRYLVRAALLLTTLASKDPGGSLTNRPINSLRDIFLVWRPQTAATLEQRLKVLDRIQAQEPAIGNKLLERLSQTSHSVSTGTSKPKWRDWVHDQDSISRREIFTGILAIQDRLLKNAGTDISRWEKLLDELSELTPDHRKQVIERLSTLSQDITEDVDRTRLSNKLRTIVSRHRSFQDANWSFPLEEVDRIEQVMLQFEPNGLVGKYAWLFDDWPALPEGKERDTHGYENRIREEQLKAITVIYQHGGVGVVESFIPHVKHSFMLGRTLMLYGIAEAEGERLINAYLNSENQPEAAFAQGIATTVITQKGREWAEAFFETHKLHWTPGQQALWLQWLPSDSKTWNTVKSLDADAQEYYWKLFTIYRVEDEDIEEATQLLIENRQPGKAVELLGHRALRNEPLNTELATQALEQLFFEEEVERLPSSYVIEELLEKLAEAPDIDRARVIRLEFNFLPTSYSYKKGNSSKLIYKELSTNPGLFAEMIAAVFRPEGTEPTEKTPEQSNFAMASWSVLDSWRIVPGADDEGNINAEALSSWVAQAREIMESTGHKIIGEQQIGQLLSGSPIGKDGQWPHEAVRALLESVAAPEIERGFEIGHHNSRGTTSRGIFDGGDQERELARIYSGYAEAIEFESPRTGAMLHRIAKDYLRQAAREDQEADLNQDLG